MLHSTFILSLLAGAGYAALTESNLEKHVGSLSLSKSFNPIKESYWTGYPHHRRTPFAVSPDGKSAYLAYLDSSETDVHVQEVDPSTFAAVGTPVTVTGGKEAGGLVAHNDGFALLTNEDLPSGTSNAPADNTPVPVIYRYTSGKQSWKTYIGGPDVNGQSGHNASPDMNGDLVYSEAAGMYGAYVVVTAYDGSAAGHFGDSIQYVANDGTRKDIQGASSTFGCSHNTGIAFEAADAAPFASICAEDQGAIWLNTKTQYMDGVKISNENVTNGGSNEPMGGMSGSYSGLARFIDSDSYIFTWVSRGAKDLTTNDWLGAPFTHSINRTVNRNVAIATFSDKNTLNGEEATSELGPDGDKQVNWITQGTADCSNAHVAAFDGTNALVTWEEIADPQCDFIAMGCKGAFTGSYFQQVADGKKVGEPVKATDVFVAGDMVTMGNGKICWPYVDMDWKLDGPIMNAASVTKMSFACMNLDGSGSSTPASSTPAASSAAATSAPAQSSAQARASSPVEEVGASTGVPIVESSAPIVQPSSVADPAPTPAPEDSALPSFEIVTSGATITPPASSAPVNTPSVDIPETRTELPLSPSELPIAPSSLLGSTPSPIASSKTPCSSATGFIPTEIPEVPSSIALPIETPVPSPESPVAPSNKAPTQSSTTLCTKGTKGTGVAPTEIPSPPSSTALPIEVPAGPEGSDVPSFPSASPSGAPGFSNSNVHPHHSGGFGSWPTGYPRPSGWGSWPTGFPRPTGGFGFGSPRPSGLGGPGNLPHTRTPCGFETRVRPAPTAA